MEEIKMSKQEFFMRLSHGELDAWNFNIEPDEYCINGIVHCFGNEDVYISITLVDEGESYYSYWDSDGVSIELLNISHN